MNHSLHTNPLFLLYQAQVNAARMGAEGARHAAKGILRLLCQYRDAFNRNAAGSSENRYSNDLSIRL